MTGNNLLLDTNIVIEVFDGNKDVADKISKLSEFYISSIVLGELYIGVNRVTNKAKHLKKVNDFLKLCTVINIDSETAIHYGETIAALYKKGKPLPINDVWIAASAIQHDLTLITRDKHFNEISNLKVKSW
ncbi:type II toxin-antitoxin system VapC family toxin [Paraflavitalea speifideaquila]|uniref:type II toxin-antitoxin system VapC family toxin n=1 Tax=Paraflavitalea speifideaquila TaxID=3076558 RepID=UPI0028E7EB72|nr:type II toxin-antitoxin system VapC family toxin [Paraflavitalea speifideiaquila]